MEKWIAAWLFSAMISVGAWNVKGIKAWRLSTRVIFAVILFPAPLLIALGSRNSFIYASDLIGPAVFLIAISQWRSSPTSVRSIALTLIMGAGALPFIGSAVGWSSTDPTLQNGINFYRVIVFVAVLVIFATEIPPAEPRRSVTSPYSVLAIVLLLAMSLQLTSVVDSNVFHMDVRADDLTSLIEARLDEKLAVMGLFRGAMGVGLCLACARGLAIWSLPGSDGRNLATVGMIAGAIGSVMIASKTSILAIAVVVFAFPFVYPSRHAAATASLSIAAAALLLAGLQWYSVAPIVLLGLTVMGTSPQGIATFTGRSGIWRTSIDDLTTDPTRLLGVPTGGELTPAVGVYHNEFLAVVMTGGLLALFLYASAIFVLARGLLPRLRSVMVDERFAAMTFIMMLVQSLFVAHLQPNLFFAPVFIPLAALYGIALSRREQFRVIEHRVEGC